MTEYAMRISVHAQGFELRPELRGFVESRLSSSLSRFRSRIRLVSVRLAIGIREGLCLPASCDAVATLRPSGDVLVRIEDVHMDVAIAKASERLRAAVEREASQGLPGPTSPRGTQAPATVQIASAANTGMSRRHRERPERREHEVWRIPAGEYWKPPGVDAAWIEQLEKNRSRTP